MRITQDRRLHPKMNGNEQLAHKNIAFPTKRFSLFLLKDCLVFARKSFVRINPNLSENISTKFVSETLSAENFVVYVSRLSSITYIGH